MKAHCLRLKQLYGVGFGLERVAKVRQSHQPDRVFHSLITADVECCPAGVGNPTVFRGEIVIEEEVMDGTWKRNVDVTPEMNMANFRLAEAIFPRRKPMRHYRNPWPG